MLYEHNIPTYNRAKELLLAYRSIGIVQGTGVGKSYITLELINTLFKDASITYVVPTNKIKEALQDMFKDVMFVTYSYLLNHEIKCDLVIFDECHHAVAPEWGKAVKKVIDNTQYKIFLTATPKDLESLTSHIVYGLSVEKAIDCGVLTPFNYVSILSEDVVVGTPYNMGDVIKKYITRPMKKYIVFCSNIAHCNQVAKRVKSWIDVDEIYISTSKHKFDLEVFNKSPNKCVLIVVNQINEGAHIKGVDCIIMLRSTKSPIVFEQQLGRGLSASSKEPLLVIDAVGNLTKLDDMSKTASKILHKAVTTYKGGQLPDRFIIVDEELLNYKQTFNIKRKEAVWTNEEIEYLKEHFYLDGYEVSKVINKKKSEIEQKAKELNLKIASTWTIYELSILKEQYYYDPDNYYKLLPWRTRSECFRMVRKMKYKTYTQDKDLLKYKLLTGDSDIYPFDITDIQSLGLSKFVEGEHRDVFK